MAQHPATFHFVAGALCLDFVNTVSSHTSSSPSEKLNEFADLVRWAREADLLDQPEAHELLAFSKAKPREASRLLEKARRIRKMLFRIFEAVRRKEPPADTDLAALNSTLRAFPIRLEIRPRGHDCFCTRIAAKAPDARLLAAVAWSAADILASDQVPYLCKCASATCGWLFVDTTKNHSRRWCMMSDCGSLAKSKRYYQRKKAKKT
jgi:predicted RNA-binding Zn ribbon-like protein